MRAGYRHCDPRFPFLWHGAGQPAIRWHGSGDGPAHYFADTPVGAWAEFLRHEGITDASDLAGVRRSLWAVELPDFDEARCGRPALAARQLFGGLTSHAACQAAARALRAAGAKEIEVRGAALLPGAARGWQADPLLRPATAARDAQVWVCCTVSAPRWAGRGRRRRAARASIGAGQGAVRVRSAGVGHGSSFTAWGACAARFTVGRMTESLAPLHPQPAFP